METGRARKMLARAVRSTVAGALALVFLGFAAMALAAGSFADPAGDNTVALDLTSATVSETPDGRLSVSVAIANAQTLPPGSRIDVWFDLDNNLNTGDEGDEALARYTSNGTLTFSRWVGNDLVRRPTAGMTASYADGTLTYATPKSALDNVPSFGLLVVTRGYRELDGSDVYAFDFLPELARSSYVSPGPASYADRREDVPVAPDVTGVRVTDAKDGTVRFAVSTPSHATFPPDAALAIAIDRDLLGETSVEDRADVWVQFRGGRVHLSRYDEVEDEWVDDEPPTRVKAGSLGNGVFVFEIHRSELDDVARFGFSVESWVEDEDEDLAALDVAPGDSLWTYRLSNRPPLRLIAGTLTGLPARPLAGRQFAINLPVRRSDTSRGITTGKVTCDVRAAGRRVRAIGSLRKGVATCTLLVPRTALSVRGSMTIRSANRSLTAWFAGAVEFGGGVDD